VDAIVTARLLIAVYLVTHPLMVIASETGDTTKRCVQMFLIICLAHHNCTKD